jgi:hypothetical protein
MDPVTFYVENGVGKRMAEAINLFTDSHNCGAIVQHVVHPQTQLPQHGDEWWIADATKLGYVIITGDLGIFPVISAWFRLCRGYRPRPREDQRPRLQRASTPAWQGCAFRALRTL